MKDQTELALNVAQLTGAIYADVRIVEHREQTGGVKNGVVEALNETGDHGESDRPGVDASTTRRCNGGRRAR